jgi:hypothetical protein
MMLTASQHAALRHVAAYARSRRDGAQAMLSHICRMSDLTTEAWREVLGSIKTSARVALHLHPDRPCAVGETVIDARLFGGAYHAPGVVDAERPK